MRICLYTETALPKIGGQELVVDALAREFTAAGHEAAVLVQHPRRPLKPADHRLPYHVVRHPRFISTWRLVRYYRHWLTRLRKSFPFDVLHCHSVHPCGYVGSLCCPQWNVPLVITSHGGDLQQGKRLAKPELVERSIQTLAAADALVSISRFTTEGFLRLCPQPRRLEQIPNGVDLAALSAPAPRPALPDEVQSGQYVLFLGRLHPRKGVDVLLQAFVLVTQTAANVRLVVAGDGEQRESLETLARSLGIAQRVSFVGSASGTTKRWLLQNARCVALPSRSWEAFPLVVLEAYAAGKPVIGSRIAGLDDLINSGQTGRLVEPQNPAALATALLELVQNPALAARWGESCRQLASDYAWPTIAARHLALYQQLTSQKLRGKAA